MKEETVEKVRSAAWKMAVAILGPFAAVVVSTLLIPDWLMWNLANSPVQLAVFGLLAVVVGMCFGVVAGVVIAGLGKRKSEDRLAAIMEAEESKRKAKAEEYATKRAQIEADKELELERMRLEYEIDEKRRERERAEAETLREEELQRGERECHMVELFRGMNPSVKDTVCIAYGNPKEGSKKPCGFRRDNDLYPEFLTLVTISEYTDKWVLTDEARGILDAHPELLEEYGRDGASVP